jgi:twitching motility two-component system response regulator PilG
MKAILCAQGFSTDTVDTPQKVFQQLITSSYDLIFLDVVLPGDMDGYKICKLIKSKNKYRDIPIIMLTSKGSTIDKVRGKFSGSNAYLTKPVDQVLLMETISKILRQRSPVGIKNT